MPSDDVALAGAFEPPTEEQWLAGVRRVILKNVPDADDAAFAAAFERQLVHRTDDGFDIRPLYTADDAIDTGLPGFAPYVRSTRAAPVPWEIRQRVWADVDGSAAVTELESGATGVLVELPADAGADVLAAALDGVYLELAPVSLATPVDDDGTAAAGGLLDLWAARGIAADDRRGTLGVDPLGSWARTGGAIDLDAAWERAAAVVGRAVAEAPNARTIVIDGTVWHDAGATPAQELGWTIAAGADAVRRLVDAGVALGDAVEQLEFRWAGTADQFVTIAKLRAARRLWARVAELAGLPAEQRGSVHHLDGSQVMMTRYDPWVNALRSTVACFAGAMGGADAVTIRPHDSLLQRGGSKLGRRVARNTQTILQSESSLSRVADPAGGSWYVEQLTDQLAQTAWAAVQAVESVGGIAEAVRSGTIAGALDDVLAARRRDVARRVRPLTGLSEFPNIDEQAPPPIASEASADATTTTATTAFAPFGLHRLADDFEAQRARADAQAASGERPTLYLATLGTPAASTARATFAKNLFEAAGIRTIDGPVEGFADAPTTVACLCSSDAVYAEQGADAAAALRSLGATRVYLAGRKQDIDGVDEEVGMGSDVLDVLTRALDELGVK